MSNVPAFRDGQPIAWTFHRATCRWLYNAVEPPETRPPQAGAEHLDVPLLRLPPPAGLSVPLGTALQQRLSCRAFSSDPLPLGDLATMLWAAYGATGLIQLGPLETAERTVPSGGGLYPLELYVLVRAVSGVVPGVHHYVPLHQGLEALRDNAVPRAFVEYLFMGQPYAAEASAVVVVTGVPERSLCKYGDRGYRYMLLEAGHCLQNLNLAATVLGRGSCNLGGFFDDELAALLRADVEEEIPLYAAALGTPAVSDRVAQRAVDG